MNPRLKILAAPLFLTLLMIGLGLMMMAPGEAAPGGSIVVNSQADDLTAGNGLCTLREAIHNANGDSDTTSGDCAPGSGADTITIPAGNYVLAIAGAAEDNNNTGDLDVTSDLVIQGAGSTNSAIDGNQLDRVLHVLHGAVVEVKDLAVVNGKVTNDAGGGLANEGGTLYVTSSIVSGNVISGTSTVGGAGIANIALTSGATTVISNSQVVTNSVVPTGAAPGGGVSSAAILPHTAALTVTASVISDNVAQGSGAGIFGGILSGGTVLLTVEQSTINNNRAIGGNGGGIAVFANADEAVVTVMESTLSNNLADGSLANGGTGGGLFSAGTAYFLSSTAVGNTATRSTSGALGSGGGLVNLGPMTVANSTISGNQATGSGELGAGIGGGIASIDVLTITNSTVVSNTAAVEGGGMAVATFLSPAVIFSSNTIVAGNGAPSAANCTNYLSTGTLTSLGHNLEDTNTCNFNATGDIVNEPALLRPLADYGGPTYTHALRSASMAVDNANNAVCAAAPVDGLDQRGVARPQGAACDIGSFELERSVVYLPLVLSP